ncbi:MAG: secondary thiamine-phosphate synthase enzyme YjbQ [Telluria sp.]
MSCQVHLEFSTQPRTFRDITRDVEHALARSPAGAGVVHLFVQHTSCSLAITENADLDVRRDLETIAQRFAPDGDPAYRHDTEGPDDMAAHARSVLTGSSLSIPFADGRLLLGPWQGIYLWEHRTASHRRRVVLTILPA